MAEITLAEAVNQALSYEMAADENVLVLGEDIGTNGGVFRVTDGLQQKLQTIGHEGYRHHVGVTVGQVAVPVREAFTRYLKYGMTEI